VLSSAMMDVMGARVKPADAIWLLNRVLIR
jgi:hypothetical protein